MATVINAGRVAMVPKGEWASATAYTRLDVVLYNGSSWVAIADSTGQVPSEDSTYWQLLASGVDPSNYYTKTETNTKLEKKANLTSLYRFAGFSIIADGSPEDAAMAFGPYADVLSSKLDTYCPGWGDVADHRSILQLIRLNNDGSYNSEYLFTGAFGDGLRRAASEAHEMGFNSLVFPADLVVYEAGVDMLEERIEAVERDKADKSEVDNALSAYATGVEYDSASKRIYLKHGSTRLTGYVDATAFIKDGMVDNVTISSGYLVITFNTESGKEPISLALTDIFNASNYYTKTEIDNAGYLTQESDPTVPSHVKGITQANITSWSGKQDKTLMTSTIPATGLLPNVVYNYGTTDTVSVTLAAGDAGVANIWCFVFTAQTAACTVTLPSSVVLGNEYAWDMVAGRKFEVTIMDNVAAVIYSD